VAPPLLSKGKSMYREVLEAAFKGVIIATATITALIVGTIVFVTMLFFRPTEASIVKEKNRQSVIETLTKEQREALGL
jgi:hypothetical protein